MYIGLHRPEDVAAEISELETMDLDYFNLHFECERDSKTGTWNHHVACPADADFACPYESSLNASRNLAHLKRRPLLTTYFQYPELANMNTTFDDYSWDTKNRTVYRLLLRDWYVAPRHWNQMLVDRYLSTRRLLQHLIQGHHCPRLEELVFPGLLVQEGWLLTSPRTKLFLMATGTLLLSVALAWVTYQDWAVAWQVGNCFLALGVFLCTCIHQAVL